MGQYRILSKLAAGGMAEVFLGKLVGASGFEKPVAIKRMLPEIARNPRSAADFLREARLCVHLVHPNVVQVLDFGTSRGQPYLVMELVDGPDLRKVVVAAARAGKPVTPPEALYIVAAVAEALSHAYEAKGPTGTPLRVVHRDVNPVNVLISLQGAVKLADFGVARAADGREKTQANLVKGKLNYIAPELLRGAEPGHASDIFLAGSLLYELLAGKALFSPRATAAESLASIAAFDERKLVLPKLDAPELAPILQRALARDPAARYPQARELADELRGVLSRRGWKIGAADLAGRLAALFPGRRPLEIQGAGDPLDDDGAAPRPASAAPARTATPVATPRAPAAEELTPRERSQPKRKRLGELLIAAGVITENQLQSVLARQRLEGGRVGEWIVGLELAPARAVLTVLSQQLGVPFVTDEKLLQAEPPKELLDRFPQEAALKMLALPVAERNGTAYVAMSDPGDLGKLDAIAFALGKKFKPVLCTEFGLRRAISRVYGGRADDLKWRQLDPSDPLAMLAGRMVDFDSAPRPTPGPAAPPSTPGFARPAYPPPGAERSPVTPWPVAYVPAGTGPDGQPLFRAVPVPTTPAAGYPATPATPATPAPTPAPALAAAADIELTPSEIVDRPTVEVASPAARDRDRNQFLHSPSD